MAAAVVLTSCATTSRTASEMRHRIVLEVSSDNPAVWAVAQNNAENLKKSLGEPTAIEVVADGGGLGMLLQPFLIS